MTAVGGWFADLGRILADEWAAALGAAVLLGLSAFFSAFETALFSLTPADLSKLRRAVGDQGTGSAAGTSGRAVGRRASTGLRAAFGVRSALTLHSELQKLLLSLLFANMAVNISFFALTADLGQLAAVRGLSGGNWVFGVGSLLLVILCGEVIPKNVAIVLRLPIVRLAAPGILLWHRLAATPLAALGAFSRFGERLAGVRVADAAPKREELRMLVDFSHSDGVIGAAERALLDNVLDFPAVRMREIMTHRVDAAVVDADLPVTVAVTTAVEAGRTRLPVRQPERDEWIGWVDARSLAVERADGRVDQWLHPPVFVSELDRADQALAKLHRERAPLAFVVDERGEIVGLATHSDLLAELFGALGDAEVDAQHAAREENGGFVLPGTASVRDWKPFFGGGGDWPDCATLGGLVTALLGHSPRAGETVHWRGVTLTVLKVHRRRAQEIRLDSAAAPAAPAPTAPPPR